MDRCRSTNSSQISDRNTNNNSDEWILDSNSGLYWNSFHRVWAKYQEEKWTYADEEGNLVRDPAEKMHPKPSSSTGSRNVPKSSKSNRREKVEYQDVYEQEEGELPSDDLDDRYRSVKKNGKETMTKETDYEEGELDSIEEALLDFHDSIPAPQPPRPFPIRLLALPNLRTSAIDPNRNLLILQPQVDEPMIIGRDRTFEPSLRLKEMEVSKTHATIFWTAADEPDSHGWHIVDNASTHGTFISPANSHPRTTPDRLSKSRKSSRPYKLHHLDTIMIASVDDPVLAFQVHLHPRFPSSCQACALFPDESNRMRLECRSTLPEAPKVADEREVERYAMSPADVKLERERKRKIEMSKLRNHFFGDESQSEAKRNKKGDHPDTPADDQPHQDDRPHEPVPKQYLDRAKLRRQTHGRSVAPSVKAEPARSIRAQDTPEPAPMNRGAAMLAKLSGDPESIKTMGKVIEAKTLGSSQAGLGSREMIVGVENMTNPKDWRQEAKLANWKRYESLKQG